jgi:hypothetical protein
VTQHRPNLFVNYEYHKSDLDGNYWTNLMNWNKWNGVTERNEV